VNLIDELHVALMPPRRRVSFLLGSAVSSSILLGDSETERLLEEVVDDGLDDDDPFFFGEKACRFLPRLQHSPSQIYIQGFQPVTRYTNIILESGF
jgi:streptomycin 6-kinase